MRLQNFVQQGGPSLPLTLIGSDPELAGDVQERLGALGLLDPPADRQFGNVSHWALRCFMARIGTPAKTVLDFEAARVLTQGSAQALYPVHADGSLASRVVQGLMARGHWLCRHPDCVNIVYVEGMNADGQPNANRPNQFNDLRMVLRINADGVPETLGSWEATTEPGRLYVEKPLNAEGAARIALDQFKAWVVGTHAGSHEALVQATPVLVYRDKNKDFKRDEDKTFRGLFGINQHWGYDLPVDDIRNASAGCLVGRTKAGHRRFMALVKEDARYRESHGYRFMSTVLSADMVPPA